MDQTRKALFDHLEVSGYLPAMRQLMMRMATPFWWHGVDENGHYRVFHNGTLTGSLRLSWRSQIYIHITRYIGPVIRSVYARW